MIQYYSFLPGGSNPSEACKAAEALVQLLHTESGESYARMILYRLAGKAAAECDDRYFIAEDEGRCVSRIWYGWGRHAGAAGNFGNFRTADDHQRMGIGGRLLDMLVEDLKRSKILPACLLCTSSKPHLVRLYVDKLGFRPAITGTEGGPLYAPLGGSPETFSEFCRKYYRPAVSLHFAPGSIGFRHEVDCLLNFALREAGENRTFGLKSFPTYESAFLSLAADPALGRLERVATDDGRTVGWSFLPAAGERETQVHPSFRDKKIQERP